MMKKKWIMLSIAALLSSSVLVFGQPNHVEAKTSADFSDLKDLDAATKAKFDAMISAGIFDGVAEGNFGLKDEMNRAQFAKVAALIYGLEVNDNLKSSSFSDVKSDDAANGYALPYIEAIKKAGITDGVGEGQFNPSGDVTKEQLATFLVRGLGGRDEAESKPGVKDETVSEWAKGYVELALELKLLNNGPDGKFGGNINATRDLLVLGSYEAKEVFEESQPSPSPSPTPTPTPTPTPVSTPVYTQSPTQEPTATPTVSPITGYNLKVGEAPASIIIDSVVTGEGNSLKVAKSDRTINAPFVGSNVTSITDVTLSDYEIDSPDINVEIPSHLGLYEINSNNIIVKFINIPLIKPVEINNTFYTLTSEPEYSFTLTITNGPPEGAVKWQYKTNQNIPTPPRGAVFVGEDILVMKEIEILTPGTIIELAAVDNDGKIIAYTTINPLDINPGGGSGEGPGECPGDVGCPGEGPGDGSGEGPGDGTGECPGDVGCPGEGLGDGSGEGPGEGCMPGGSNFPACMAGGLPGEIEIP